MSVNAQKLLNERYAQLCTSLGDALFKRDMFQAEIDRIKSEIKLLNDLTPDLNALVQQATKHEQAKKD